MPSRRTYADRRPCTVVESLHDLAGAASGPVVLPQAIAWTGRREYDLNDPADAAVLYERVIVEATDTAALVALIDERILRRLWPTLFLPPRARRAWEDRFPDLAAAV